MSGFWHLVPGRSIGPFTFGDHIEEYIDLYDLRKRRQDCSVADWETYELAGFGICVVVEDGRISSIHCEDEVQYVGTNLIGLSISDIYKLLGQADSVEDDEALGCILYYDRLGIALFIENDIVDVIACHPTVADGGKGK